MGLGNEVAQVVESLGIGGVGNPQAYVAIFRILVLHVFHEAFPVAFMVELRVVGQAVLDGATDDGVGLNVAVGLSNDLAVDATGSVGGGGTMVFDGLSHDFDLVGRKPLSQFYF